MTHGRVARVALGSLGALLIGTAVAACASTTATNNFKGEKHGVAETLSTLRTSATSGDAAKICSEVLAVSVKEKLGSGDCQAKLKNQLAEITSFELTTESIKLQGSRATARVKSTQSGKSRLQTVSLVREGHVWKVSGLG